MRVSAGGCGIMYNQLNLYVTPESDRCYTRRRGNGSDAVCGDCTRASHGLKSLSFIDNYLNTMCIPTTAIRNFGN